MARLICIDSSATIVMVSSNEWLMNNGGEIIMNCGVLSVCGIYIHGCNVQLFRDLKKKCGCVFLVSA